MTEKQLIKRLILYNLGKVWAEPTNEALTFSLNWGHTQLTYNTEKNKDKSLSEMVYWFYEKIIMLSNQDD